MTPRSLLAPARLGGQPILRAQTDERLVDLASDGSRPAFEAIVSRYRRPLLAYAARFLGQERAEDAVQQTFVKAYTSLTAGETVRTLRPWLYRIAHNTSLNMLRDRSLQHAQLTDDIDGVERPDQTAERRQELDEVLSAVKALPARQRDAIVLRALEGRTYDQIAQSLGVSDGAVRQLLSRARCTMRAGIAAVTPVGLLVRIASPFADAPATLVAGGGAGGGTFAMGKVCAAAVAAAVAGGGVSALPDAATDGAPRDRQASVSTQSTASNARPALAGSSGALTSPARTSTQSPSRATLQTPATQRRKLGQGESPAPAEGRAGGELRPVDASERGQGRSNDESGDASPTRPGGADRQRSQGAPRSPVQPSRPAAPSRPGGEGGFGSRQGAGEGRPAIAATGADGGRFAPRAGTNMVGAR